MNNLRPLSYLTLLLVLLIGSCQKDPEPIKEVPDDIIPTKPCSTLYADIMALFPEYDDNRGVLPELFSDTVQNKIVLTEQSEVYVTFISEGAFDSNSFGYYTYKKDNPPTSASDLSLHILFPNVSNTVLHQGDRLQLGDGTFPAGTVVGFFLVHKGWAWDHVTYKDRTIHYTDYNFNVNQHQQHILFKEGTCADIVLAFEDMPLDDETDFDFNDIIFTVSDNNNELETTRFDIDKIVVKQIQ